MCVNDCMKKEQGGLITCKHYETMGVATPWNLVVLVPLVIKIYETAEKCLRVIT